MRGDGLVELLAERRLRDRRDLASLHRANQLRGPRREAATRSCDDVLLPGLREREQERGAEGVGLTVDDGVDASRDAGASGLSRGEHEADRGRDRVRRLRLRSRAERADRAEHMGRERAPRQVGDGREVRQGPREWSEGVRRAVCPELTRAGRDVDRLRLQSRQRGLAPRLARLRVSAQDADSARSRAARRGVSGASSAGS